MRENINASENVFKCAKRSLEAPTSPVGISPLRIVWWPGCQCLTEHNQDPRQRQKAHLPAPPITDPSHFKPRCITPSVYVWSPFVVFKFQWINQHAVVCEPGAGCEWLQLWQCWVPSTYLSWISPSSSKIVI